MQKNQLQNKNMFFQRNTKNNRLYYIVDVILKKLTNPMVYKLEQYHIETWTYM